MSIRRITISVPEQVASRIKLAAGGAPVSTWVTQLIEQHLDDAELDRLWQEFYQQVNPGKTAIRRADAVMKRLAARATKGPRRRGAA